MEAENAKNKVVNHQSYVHSRKNKYHESSMYQQYIEKSFDNRENMLWWQSYSRSLCATELNNLDYRSLTILGEFHIEICVQEDLGFLLLL